VSGQFRNTSGEIFKAGNLVLTLVNEDGRNVTHAVEDGRELPLDALEIEPDGHFVLHQLPPGKYRIGWLGQMWIKRPPMGEAAIYLAGGNTGGHDLLRDGFEVKAGQEITDASIVIATGPEGIKVKVRDQTGKPRSRVVVLVVPVEEMKMQWHRYQSECSYPKGGRLLLQHSTRRLQNLCDGGPAGYPLQRAVELWGRGQAEMGRPESRLRQDSSWVHARPCRQPL
jgi:hypothetical protein